MKLREAGFLLLCLFHGRSAPTPDSGIVLTEMDFNEPVSATLFGDADGDGLKDAVLLFDNRLEVHKTARDGSISRTSQLSIKLPSNCVAVDVGPLDPQGSTRANAKSVLIAATTRGIVTRRLDANDATFMELPLPAMAGSLFARASGAKPVPMPLRVDFENDGSSELLYPLADGIAVFAQTALGWVSCGVAPVSVSVDITNAQKRPGSLVRQTFELPRAAMTEVRTGDGKMERLLSISRSSEAWIYALRNGKIQLIEHVRGLFRFDSEDRFREARGTRRNEDTNDRAVGLVATDLNADGIPDFVASRFREGEVLLSIGKPGVFAVDQPDRSMDVDGWAILAQARDFNGDGLPDLVVPRLPKLGIGGALRALLSRRVTIDLWIFKNTGRPDVVGSAPDWKHSLDLDILLEGEEGKISVSARLITGFIDYNGDRLLDFLTLKSATRLAVFPGNRESLIESDPGLEVDIPDVTPFGEIDFRTADLNGDNRDDFVIVYGPNRRGARNKLLFGVWK